MTTKSDHHDETPLERATRDPHGTEHDWLAATEEGTGQMRLEGAIDVAVGDGSPPDSDPVVNGYRGGDRRLATPERLAIQGKDPE